MSPSLRGQREQLVREHMESENHHDFETTLGTFEASLMTRLPFATNRKS
jgi:hypothetical protein